MILRILLIVLLPILSFAGETLSFDRPVKKGDFFRAEITLVSNIEYKFILIGPAKPILKRESVSLTFFGDMKILEVNSHGNPSQMLLSVTNASGILNGIHVNSKDLSGRRIHADLRKYPVLFTDADNGSRIPRDSARLLAAVFHVPAENALKETLGSSLEDPTAGKRWRISVLPVLESLRKRGFEINENSILSNGCLEEREKFKGIDCWKIGVNLLSKDVPTLDFRMKVEIWVPENPKLPVVRMIRSGTEVIDKILPDEHPIAAGSNVRVITNERLEAILIPAEEPKPAIPKSNWSDMFLRK